MSEIGQDKVLDSNPKKCTVCDTFQRKIDDVEQSLTGRDQIISILQSRLKKCESNYKNLFDNFEKLRFDHCTALQDNYSLKKINSKLEESDLKNNNFDLKGCCSCSHNIKNGGNALDNKRLYQDSTNSGIKEINNIENLVCNQNQILKQLLDKIIKEIKSCNCDNPLLVSQDILNVQEDFKRIESGDNFDTDPRLQELTKRVDSYKILLDQCQEENESIKKLLRTKSSIQESHAPESLQIVRSSLDDPLKKKISFRKSTENCACEKGEGTKQILLESRNIALDLDKPDMEENIFKEKISVMETELKQQKLEYEECKCNMLGQMREISENNQVLSDTLDVITAENKSNLEAVGKLKEELKKVNDENENKHNELKSRIAELENQLEDCYMNERQLQDTLEGRTNEINELKKEKELVEAQLAAKECECDKLPDGQGCAHKEQVKNIECTCDEVSKELQEKCLELAEYDEENRALNQKIESLTNYNAELKGRISELEEQLFKPQEPKSPDCCQEKLAELDTLQETVRIKEDEIGKLNQENADLQYLMEKQKKENKKETERLQEMVNHSQRQVELLLKEHDEKTAQIQNVANELDGIRKSVNDENNSFLEKIGLLEQERDQLKKELEERNNKTDCKCDSSTQLEVERMKAELYKKQEIIWELEKSVDTSNAAMKEFEETIQSLRCENECLKSKQENIEELKQKLDESRAENKKTQEQLKTQQRASDTCQNKCRNVEIEKEKLKLEMEKTVKDQERYRRSSETEKLELQMELAGVREEHALTNAELSGKLENCQKAYEEMRNQLEKKCFDNEKLQEEVQNIQRQNEELKNQSDRLECECDQIKNENRANIEEQFQMDQKIRNLEDCCEKITRQYTVKCLENDDLNANIEKQKNECCNIIKDKEELQVKFSEHQKELDEMTGKCCELQRDSDQKTQDLKKLKKQYESCSKQSQISREEYNNLRKEYKEIKMMLANQMQKYKNGTNPTEMNGGAKPKSCRLVSDLRKQLFDKETQLIDLQKKLKQYSYEIIDLKDYIHKLISDNNILKSAINSLICNLERKIRGCNSKTRQTESADMIAGEILQSLTNIESTIIRKSQNRFCPTSCTSKECDCISQIESRYRELEQPSMRTQEVNRCSHYSSGNNRSKTDEKNSYERRPSDFINSRQCIALQSPQPSDIFKKDPSDCTNTSYQTDSLPTKPSSTFEKTPSNWTKTSQTCPGQCIAQSPLNTFSGVPQPQSDHHNTANFSESNCCSRQNKSTNINRRSTEIELKSDFIGDNEPTHPDSRPGTTSRLSTTGCSDLSTDSEDCPSDNFLDKNSMEALKGTIEKMKQNTDSVMNKKGLSACCYNKSKNIE